MGAIGLNPIRLDRIGLDPIRINAIKLGVPGAASGSDRPYIDPEVLASLKAVCICYGKSNDDPDRAVVRNLVDTDNPFIISNAAFKLNSGYGKYEVDFASLNYNNTTSVFTATYKSCSISKIIKDSVGNIFYNWGQTLAAINPTKIQVTGLDEIGAILEFTYLDESGNSTTKQYSTDGIYDLPASAAYQGDSHNTNFRFSIRGYIGDCDITVTQIPSYQGAFVTDGVDDLITSTKTAQEMLGGSKEITVVSMIGQLSTPNVNNYTNTIRNQPGSTGSYNKVEVSAIDKIGIYGYSFDSRLRCSLIDNILGDKQDYSVSTATQIENISAKYLVQGWIDTNGLARELSSVAWYWTVIANKVLTTDQINQIIAYYNLDRCVEPTVWYDVQKQGLTNDTPDSYWYLKDYSGNGYDMTLYNYAKTPESGINADGGLQSDGVDDYGKVTGLPIYKDYTVIADYERISGIDNAWTGALVSKAYIANQGAFILMETNGLAKHSYSFGTTTTFNKDDSTRTLLYQSKYKCGDVDLNTGTGVDGDTLWLGTYRDNYSSFFNGAIYSLMSFPYSMSEFLIERQLKKHKLGTLYPDMVEFRPIVKSNLPYSSISYSVNPGEYISVDSMVTITVTLPNTSDELMAVSCNAISDISISGDNGVYEITGKVVKSPQKINLVISSYLTMLNNETLISNETLIKNE